MLINNIYQEADGLLRGCSLRTSEPDTVSICLFYQDYQEAFASAMEEVMGKQKTNAQFISEIKDLPFVALDEYVYCNTKIRFKCSKCGHVWSVTPNNILQGHGCSKCAIVNRIKGVNIVIERYDSWLLVDISTKVCTAATMAVDAAIWEDHVKCNNGRVFAQLSKKHNYIRASHNTGAMSNKILVQLFHHNVLPKKSGFEIDHIRHGTINFIDNRRSNLRYATRSQNNQNKGLQSNNTSGTVGVSWDKGSSKWLAEMHLSGKKKRLGCYKNKADAIEARRLAEQEYFGEFSYSSSQK